MKVKKFVAPTMSQAMNQIRAELGNDAVILNSKVIHTGGILGFFKKRNFEVVAAIDPKPVNENTIVKNKTRKGLPLDGTKKVTKVPEKNIGSSLAESQKISKAEEMKVLNEINQLKSMISQLPQGTAHPYEKLPDPLKHVNNKLSNQEVGDPLKEEILNSLLEKWYMNGGKAKEKEVLEWAKEELINRINNFQTEETVNWKKFINVVGPTGVGKTTTLAKIASTFVINQRKKIAFITTDTYRIGAIEQLKTYAQILGVPLEVAYNLEDFKRAAERFYDYDHIFIDTAGRNFRKQEYVDDLKKVIDFEKEIESFLVLSLTAKQSDMDQIFAQFSLIPIHGLIFTKADETASYGSMINFILNHQVGVSFITNGQNVPDDIVKSTPKNIVNTVLGESEA